MFLIPLLELFFAKYRDGRAVLSGLGLSAVAAKPIFVAVPKNKVKIVDELSPAEMRSLYQEADALIHLSLFEGGVPSLVLLEAMASGLPVISFRYPGIDNFLKNEVNSLLVDENDLNGVIDQFDRLFRDAEFKNAIVANAAKTASEYHWEVQVQKWERLINEA